MRVRVTGGLEPEFERAVAAAAKNIREYAQAQLPREWSVDYPDGRKLGQIVRPLDAMGAYVPAGRYPLPSTVLMTVIPAQVAGVATICVACPNPSVEILGIAHWLGVTHMFRMGGAQAIAALRNRDRAEGRPHRRAGNIYVAAAKKLIAETGIDFVAGPTEIVIIAADGNPLDCRRPSGASRARCGCVGDSADHVGRWRGGSGRGGAATGDLTAARWRGRRSRPTAQSWWLNARTRGQISNALAPGTWLHNGTCSRKFGMRARCL